MGEEGEVRRLGEATYLFPVCEPYGAVFLSKMAGAHQDATETLRECTQSILNCISVMENGRKNISLTSSNGGFCFEKNQVGEQWRVERCSRHIYSILSFIVEAEVLFLLVAKSL